MKNRKIPAPTPDPTAMSMPGIFLKRSLGVHGGRSSSSSGVMKWPKPISILL